MSQITNLDAIDGPPADSSIDLIWTDPPYGTGKVMRGDSIAYRDYSDTTYVLDGIKAWLPAVSPDGTVVICCDYRLAPLITDMVLLEGWAYRGEIIWEFGLGRPRMSWWPVRHNNLLTFTRTKTSGKFDSTAIPKTKRLAPKKGYEGDKPSGSVWDFTFSNTHPERVGYPNQKSMHIIKPFILAHTKPGDLVADPFAGSGSTGVAAISLDRRYLLNDINFDTTQFMRKRLKEFKRIHRDRSTNNWVNE